MTPIIYLHGFASSPASRKAQAFRTRLVEVGAQVTVPDLAYPDFERLTITGQLAEVERAANGAPVSLIGSSMGGYVAALYAARHPEVQRVVLMAPAFGFARRWAALLGPARVEQWRTTGWMEVLHYGENRMRRLGWQLMEDAEAFEDFPAFSQPALIFHGRRDEIVPVQYSQQFAAAKGNVALEVLDSGHDLLDTLDYIVPKAIDFLMGRP